MFLHSLAATTQDVSLVRITPDPQQQEFPCPHQSIEFRCQISVAVLAIQWTLPIGEILEFIGAAIIGADDNSSDNVYSATLTNQVPDSNSRFFYTSTLLVIKPVNGSNLTCVGSDGLDSVKESTSIILSGKNFDSSSIHLKWPNPHNCGLRCYSS